MSYSWDWSLEELNTPRNGFNVFSCFACGGGSSMGYKRAGYTVLGCCEIDPEMNGHYVRNLHPKHNFLMDIRDFNKLDTVPDELIGIDILDGSPPCSSFSTSGSREEKWGTVKKFREGQVAQTLDDLFFDFIETVDKLRPKVAVAENVTGLLLGNAKGYVNEIIKRFQAIGYDVQLFKLNAAYMNVPQRRERVFFIANRMSYPKLKLDFDEKPVLFGEVRSEKGTEVNKNTSAYTLLSQRRSTDVSLAEISERVRGVYSGFNMKIVSDDKQCCTISANGAFYRMFDGMRLSNHDHVAVQSFPRDYDFGDSNLVGKVQYVCGMSVPPNMMANIAEQIYKQWLSKEEVK